MPSIFAESVGRINLPLIIPDVTHPTAPSALANENMSGNNIIPPDTLLVRHSYALFIFFLHDEEQSRSTFNDIERTVVESIHDKRTCDTLDHPHALSHALDTVFRGDLGLIVQDTVTGGRLGLFRIPDKPANSSTPLTSGRPSAGVARRNRFFVLDGNSTAGPRPDELATGDAFPPKVETQEPSPIELDGGVKEAAESDSASLNPTDISIHRNPSSKVKACTTIH